MNGLCHSERSEESRSESILHTQGEIPRCARNDSGKLGMIRQLTDSQWFFSILLNFFGHHVGVTVAAVAVAQDSGSLLVADHLLLLRIEVQGAADAVGSVGQV